MWATQEALTTRGLLTKLKGEFDIDMHPNTLCVTLKAMGFVWNRTRHNLKKKRDELKFRIARAQIEDMLAAVDRGEIDLDYCDEAGFTQTHPNRSA